jgi:hypothetical protein
MVEFPVRRQWPVRMWPPAGIGTQANRSRGTIGRLKGGNAMNGDPLELILLHRYREPRPAVDDSGFLCHGACQNTTQLVDGAEPGSGAFEFASGNSAVKVAPAPQWRNLQALVIDVVVRLDTPLGGRRNIIEGDGCFALFVDGGGGVHFDMYSMVEGQSAQAWNGLSTAAHPPGSPFHIAPDRWTHLQASFDGLATARLWADDQLVAQRSDFLAPLGSPGAAGVTIGNWTLWDQYALHGAIDTIAVWKLNDRAIARDFVARLDDAGLQSWTSFIDCLRSSQAAPDSPDLRAALANLFRHLSRAIAASDQGHKDQLSCLVNEYAALWRANRIAEPAFRQSLDQLYCVLLKLDYELAGDLRRVLDAFDAGWTDRARACFQRSGIEAHDPQWASAFGGGRFACAPATSKEPSP